MQINARTYYGARNALETLSQLINYEDTCDCLITVRHGYIEDEPAFPYRGLMIGRLRLTCIIMHSFRL